MKTEFESQEISEKTDRHSRDVYEGDKKVKERL